MSPLTSPPLPALYSPQLQFDCGKERPGFFRALPGLPDPSPSSVGEQDSADKWVLGVCKSVQTLGASAKSLWGPPSPGRGQVSPWASGSESRQVRQLEREAREEGFGTSEPTGCGLKW